MPSMSSALPASSLMSIGEVLARLRPEFPDVTISKIRFLESEGLVEPARTPSGYRKFSHADVARLRYVLATQRDHYLPLRVIREHLDAIDRGLEPPAAPGEKPRVPRSADDDLPGPRALAGAVELRLSRAELAEAAGLDAELLDQVEAFGLLAPVRGSARGDAPGWYDADALVVATAVAELTAYGLEPRHLRSFRTAADRESAWSRRSSGRCCGSAARRPGPAPRRSPASSGRRPCACTRPWCGPASATSSAR